MDDWLPIVVGALTGLAASSPSWGPVLFRLLTGRAASGRADAAAVGRSWQQHAAGLQETIDALRDRLDVAERDIRECVADRAALRQEVADLKRKV